MELIRTSSFGVDLVSLDALKEQLKIEHDEDNELIRSLQRAAYIWVENYTARALLSTSWHYTTDKIRENCEVRQALPFPPTISVENLYHAHSTQPKQLISRYTVEIKNGVTYVCFISRGLPVSINYTSGYGPTVEEVPEPIKLAVKTLVTSWYENRDGSGLACGIPQLVIPLLAPYQIRRLV